MEFNSILVLGLLFILLFFIIRILLKKSIFEKIRLIYKIIRDTKTAGGKTSQDDFQSMDNIKQEVALWASKTSDEIKNLKSLEDYRKNYIGNVAHELKTPIFTIQGYLHTLIEGGLYDDNINQKYLDKALQNVNRLETIIADLDSISNLERDNEILNEEVFDIKNLIAQSIEVVESHAREKNISIDFPKYLDKEFPVLADKNKIGQVLINLLINAIKYGNTNGKVDVKIFDFDQDLLIEVSDDGIGIEEQHIKHVFDRFYRADPSRSRASGGSGLGLAIVKHIIEAHGQSINLRSTKGEGSTFGFTLKKA